MSLRVGREVVHQRLESIDLPFRERRRGHLILPSPLVEFGPETVAWVRELVYDGQR